MHAPQVGSLELFDMLTALPGGASARASLETMAEGAKGSTAGLVRDRLADLVDCIDEHRGDALPWPLLNAYWSWAETPVTQGETNLTLADAYLGRVSTTQTHLEGWAEWVRWLRFRASSPLPVVITELIPVVRRELGLRKEVRGVFDFDDMLERLWEALQHDDDSASLRALRERYRYGIVDEFQDTDETQWSIFRRIFVESPADNRLIVIGDPKQAIYGFRNADVSTYHRAKREIIDAGGCELFLRDCYRATRSLVKAQNQILGAEDFFTGANRYPAPVRSARKDLELLDRRGRRAPPICLWHLVGRPRLYADLIRKSLYRSAADEIARLLHWDVRVKAHGSVRPLQPQNIFVLTRTRTEGDMVGDALREAGLPHAFFKQEGLFQTSEAREVLALLRAVERPWDESRFLQLCLTPFAGVTLEDLPQCRGLPADHPARARLQSWRSLADQQRWSTFFQAVITETHRTSRELFVSADQRALTNALHIFEILEEEAFLHHASLSNVIARLEAYMQGALQPTRDNGNVQRLESERNAVQILTMHKAKGLEADVVFVVGGFGAMRPDYTRPQVYHDIEGKRLAWADRPPAEVRARVEAEEREEAERLLYVALTRACARVYLPYFGPPLSGSEPGDAVQADDEVPSRAPRVQASESAQGQMALGFQPASELAGFEGDVEFDYRYMAGPYRVLNARLQALVGDGLDRELFDYRVVDVVAEPSRQRDNDRADASAAFQWEPPPVDEPLVAEIRFHFELSKRRAAGVEITSYTRMKAMGAASDPDQDLRVDPDAEERDEQLLPSDLDELPGGAEVGVFLHEVLEHVPYDALAHAPDAAHWLELPKTRDVFDSASARQGLPAALCSKAAELVFAAMRVPIVVPHLHLANGLAGLGDGPQRIAEMTFLHPVPEQAHPPLDELALAGCRIERGFIRGIIDLVFEADGRYYILDWKSDRLPSYEEDALSQHVEREYAIQLRLYALGAIRALGLTSAKAFEDRFGGVLYCFLRGMKTEGQGVFFERPSWHDVEDWDQTMRRESNPWGYVLPPRRRSA